MNIKCVQKTHRQCECLGMKPSLFVSLVSRNVKWQQIFLATGLDQEIGQAESTSC